MGDLAEARRLYQLQLIAFDGLVESEADLVEQCEELALSEPDAAIDWLKKRRDFAELVISQRDMRANCRESHDLVGMEREDC